MQMAATAALSRNIMEGSFGRRPERPWALLSNTHWMAGEPKGSRKSAGKYALLRNGFDRALAGKSHAGDTASRSIATSACRLARSR